MVIRPAFPADAQAIAEVHVASWQRAYRDIIPDDWLASQTVEKRRALWEQILADPAQTTLVSEADHGIVGWTNYGPSRDEDLDRARVVELNGIYVVAGHWDRGLGRMLWLEVLNRIRAGPAEAIVLWVFTANARARRFYENAGFAPDGITKIIRRGRQEIPAVRYRRNLP